MDDTKFQAAAARAQLRKPEGGIGMLGEKALHSALKYYYEPDETCHEREAWGFFADVLNEDGIIEIQTRSLWSLKKKLPVYLERTRVTLVHPVVRRRSLIYLDPETGELSAPRLSPVRGSVYTAFPELIHIKEFLAHPNLLVVVPIVDAEEYRIRRVPAVKQVELGPTALLEEWVFACPEDWLRLVPEPLQMTGFTVRELAEASKNTVGAAGLVASTLLAAGALSRERAGRAYRYFVPNEETGKERIE